MAGNRGDTWPDTLYRRDALQPLASALPRSCQQDIKSCRLTRTFEVRVQWERRSSSPAPISCASVKAPPVRHASAVSLRALARVRSRTPQKVLRREDYGCDTRQSCHRGSPKGASGHAAASHICRVHFACPVCRQGCGCHCSNGVLPDRSPIRLGSWHSAASGVTLIDCYSRDSSVPRAPLVTACWQIDSRDGDLATGSPGKQALAFVDCLVS